MAKLLQGWNPGFISYIKYINQSSSELKIKDFDIRLKPLPLAATLFVLLLFLYLRHVNTGLKLVPPEAQRLSPHRWTEKEIRETFDRISTTPIDVKSHLPPVKGRRYIVVGGSGLVGGAIILQLLLRGEDPRSIRNVDFAKPRRKDLLTGDATKIDYVHADITNEESVEEAFLKPWHSSVQDRPLTVFHTAAIIIPEDRAERLQHKCSRVNTLGTAHVVSKARQAGADVLVSTSSGSIAIRPCNFWFAPWKSMPDRFVQPYLDPGKDVTIRERHEYSGNYAISKAHAEELVLKANDGHSFKTGSIRPACGVYGNRYDTMIGNMLLLGTQSNAPMPTWISSIVESCIHMDNVALAHLLFEDALLTSPQTVSGRSFMATDPNKACRFEDMYKVLSTLTPFHVALFPPVLMMLLAHAIELYVLFRDVVPLAHHILPTIKPPMIHLQPAMLQVAMSHQTGNNDEISKPPSEGGLGYKGIYTSLEGMCTQVREWVDHYGGRLGDEIKSSSTVEEIKNIGTVPASTTK